MTTNHTPTPWTVKPSSGGIAKGFDVVCGGNRMAFVAANPGARERAQRIADCVNQCDAAVSRELQATRAMRDAANATNARLLAQRDELVAALENLVETHDAGEAMHVEFWNIARAALAKVQA